MELKDLPIGIEDYKDAVGKYYIDKTLLIRDLIERGEGKSILLTRPRRFGKSLALSMVDYFFNQRFDSSGLFKGKEVASCDSSILDKMNSLPVIHLNMKGIEESENSSILDKTKDRISLLFREYGELLDSEKLTEADRREFRLLYDNAAGDTLFMASLQRLSRFLFLHYEKRVVLLIDEYDAPIEASFLSPNSEKVLSFFKGLYGGALKGNGNLYFALISGVMQISKESLFSGLNNLLVSSIASPFLSRYFGFSEAEVIKLLEDYGIPIDISTLKRYYGGYYLPNGDEILNPWSILNFASERKLRCYWANTGTNALLLNVIALEKGGENLLDFLNNAAMRAPFRSAISHKDINENAEASLSFLAQAGYLSIKGNQDDFADDLFEFRIPNLEIFSIFKTEVIGRSLPSSTLAEASRLKEALLNGNDGEVQRILEQYLLSSFSCFDLVDERNYQNAVTGLLSMLFDTYVVKNEVDTGTGRCDILMIPKSKDMEGLVIEVKRSRAKAQISKARLEGLAKQAIAWIKRKDYVEILRKAGTRKANLYGFAFQNKSSCIVSEEIDLD